MGLFDFVGDIFGGGGDSQPTSVQQVQTLNAGQQGLLQRLISQIQPQIGQPGIRAGGAGALQQQAFGVPGLGQAQQAFGQSIGFDPSQINQALAPVGQFAQNLFQNRITPSILGALGQQGAARSSGAADILGRAGSDLASQISSQFAPLQFGALQQSLQRGFQAPQAALGAAGQLFNLGSGQRGIGEQQRQSSSPFFNPALNFLGPALGTPAFGNIATPGFRTPGIGEQLLPVAGQALGGFLGTPAGSQGFSNLLSGLF